MDFDRVLPKLPPFNPINNDTNIRCELENILEIQESYKAYTEEYGHETWIPYIGPENPFLICILLSPPFGDNIEPFSNGPYQRARSEISNVAERDDEMPVGYYYIYPFTLKKNADIPIEHKEFHLSFFKHRLKLLNPKFVIVFGKTTWINCITFITKVKPTQAWIYNGILLVFDNITFFLKRLSYI